ncbi:hypothetical protein KJ840_02955 [Patescibacteria group bacterium]|nr:hypothetical protein [Patescibacteria group bacterium]
MIQVKETRILLLIPWLLKSKGYKIVLSEAEILGGVFVFVASTKLIEKFSVLRQWLNITTIQENDPVRILADRMPHPPDFFVPVKLRTVLGHIRRVLKFRFRSRSENDWPDFRRENFSNFPA